MPWARSETIPRIRIAVVIKRNEHSGVISFLDFHRRNLVMAMQQAKANTKQYIQQWQCPAIGPNRIFRSLTHSEL